jgi:hypothetical protein
MNKNKTVYIIEESFKNDNLDERKEVITRLLLIYILEEQNNTFG